MTANGGVVMVTFVSAFVSNAYREASEPLWKEWERRTAGVTDPAERERIGKDVAARMPKIKVTIAQVADHVDHVRKLAGADHVGLGGDYDGNDSWPEGMEDVSSYPRLFAELVRRGWSDEDLAQAGERQRAARDAPGRGGRGPAPRRAAAVSRPRSGRSTHPRRRSSPVRSTHGRSRGLAV